MQYKTDLKPQWTVWPFKNALVVFWNALMSSHGMFMMHQANYRACKHVISLKLEWLTYQKLTWVWQILWAPLNCVYIHEIIHYIKTCQRETAPVETFQEINITANGPRKCVSSQQFPNFCSSCVTPLEKRLLVRCLQHWRKRNSHYTMCLPSWKYSKIPQPQK